MNFAHTQRDVETAQDADYRRRKELGGFLRMARENLNPAEAGGPVSPRRRVKGWLREEVAREAGISATWYVWLEQGRDVRASPRALNGLARALRLDAVKRAYLFGLARPDLNPGETDSAGEGGPSEELKAFVKALSPHPAYVLDAWFDVVFCNCEAAELFGGFDLSDKWSRNIIGRLFTDLAWRSAMADWETIATSAVGQFRAASSLLSDDAGHRAFVDALCARDAAFGRLWTSHKLATSPIWTKTFRRPEGGEVSYRHASFKPSGLDEPYRVTIYTPV